MEELKKGGNLERLILLDERRVDMALTIKIC
jgi:hypothetical protein